VKKLVADFVRVDPHTSKFVEIEGFPQFSNATLPIQNRAAILESHDERDDKNNWGEEDQR
jgi:hypothetical protein